jgi:hypothetical protein
LNRSWKPLVQRLVGPRYSGSPFIWYVLCVVLPTPKHFFYWHAMLVALTHCSPALLPHNFLFLDYPEESATSSET